MTATSPPPPVPVEVPSSPMPVAIHGIAKLEAMLVSIVAPPATVDSSKLTSSVTIHWIPTSETG